MKTNANAATRGALSAFVLMVTAILSSLTCGACASNDATAPAAADGPHPTLREALSADHLDGVALLDSRTPFPPTEGRAALFVDGGFYARAAGPVRSYVLEELHRGIPVVLFGDQAGYDALRSSVGAADLPADPELEGNRQENGSPGLANPDAGARGLKVYPSPLPDGLASSAAIEISGSPDNPAPLIGPAIRWAEDCAGQSA